MTDVRYPVHIVPLSEEDGGGFMAYYPDLIGCLSDGQTEEEALANARDAFGEWMETEKRLGHPLPEPCSAVHRMHKDRADMVAVIDKLMTTRSEVDDQLDEIRRQLRDLEQRIEASASWARSSSLTGVMPDDGAVPPVRAIC